MPSVVLRIGEDVLALASKAARAKGLGESTAASRVAIEAIVRCYADAWTGNLPPADPAPPAPPPAPARFDAAAALDAIAGEL